MSPVGLGGYDGTLQAQVIREGGAEGRLLADRLGGGGEHREVTVGLAGRGRVVRGVNVEDIDGVQPACAVAQFMACELSADVGEVEAGVACRGLDDAVHVVDAVVKGLMIAA